MNQPLVSCICITNNRQALLLKSMECFRQQDYPNLELIISYPENDQATKSLVQESSIRNVIPLERGNELTLGEARNEAVRKCNGEYVCIWDDDDWHHPERISSQIQGLISKKSAGEASVLTRIFLYDNLTGKGYLSFDYTWDGTLLCRKGILLQNQYAHRNSGEDTHIIPFLEARKLLVHVSDRPFLYTYVYHGHNTWAHDHFVFFTERSTPLNNSHLLKVQEQLMS